MPICLRPTYTEQRAAEIQKALHRLGGVSGAAQLLHEYVQLAGSSFQSTASLCADEFISTGGPIKIRIDPGRGDYINQLFLYDAQLKPLAANIASNRNTNQVFEVGPFPQGTRLVFGIYVVNTKKTFYQGPASRNPDKKIHALVNYSPEGYKIKFEDLTDFNFNDTNVTIMSGVYCGESADLANVDKSLAECGKSMCEDLNTTFLALQRQIEGIQARVDGQNQLINQASGNLSAANAAAAQAEDQEKKLVEAIRLKTEALARADALVNSVSARVAQCK